MMFVLLMLKHDENMTLKYSAASVYYTCYHVVKKIAADDKAFNQF